MEFGAGVDLPHDLTIGCPNTMKHPLDAIDIDTIAVHDRTAARTVVVAVVVLVIRRVFKLPKELSGRAPKTAQAGLVAMTVEQEEPALADGRHAISHSNRLLPDDSKSISRPGGDDSCFG